MDSTESARNSSIVSEVNMEMSSEQSGQSTESDSSKEGSSLRRSSRKKKSTVISEAEVDYNLRKNTIVNRVLSEQRRREPRQPKPKAKPPPLSKYRRRAANARERSRMVDINDAFEELRNVLPNIEAGPANKLTKITTLRLAMNYISALRHTLGFEDELNSDASSLQSSSASSSSSGDELCLSPSDGELMNSDDTDLLSSDDTEHITSEELLSSDLDLVQLDLDGHTDLLLK